MQAYLKMEADEVGDIGISVMGKLNVPEYAQGVEDPQLLRFQNNDLVNMIEDVYGEGETADSDGGDKLADSVTCWLIDVFEIPSIGGAQEAVNFAVRGVVCPGPGTPEARYFTV
jgi:hypothetical protein